MKRARLILALSLAATCVAAPRGALGGDVMLDLSKVANRAFVDQTAGDGKGGWSDQGPDNSLRGMKSGVETLEGIDFRILNENSNDGRAILTFDGADTHSDLKEATVAVPPAPAAESSGTSNGLSLYLLQSACWVRGAGQPIGKIRVDYPQGEPAVFPVLSGRDLADWWNPTDLPNAQVVYEESNGSAVVGVYLSKFSLPADRGRPRSVTLSTDRGPTWIVLAMTLSGKSLPLAGGRWTAKADAQWKAVDLSDLIVRPGTALDLSFLMDAPAGRHGFVHINDRGEMAFSDAPQRAARFLCDSYNMTLIGETLSPFGDKEINELADQEARMGINAFRPHNLDHFIMAGSSEDGVPNPKQLETWDRLSAALKKRGIYLYLDVATYSLFNKDNIWTKAGAARRFDSRIYWDPDIREIYRKGATALLTHVNPYTGLALKDDPQVLAMQTRNESFFQKSFERDRKLGIAPDPRLVEKFHGWLKARYGTTEALRAAWGDVLGHKETIEDAPFPDQAPRGPARSDFARFCIDSDQELFLWMQNVLKNIGVRVPITDFNYVPSYQLTLIRDVEPLVDMHAYHEHPSNYVRRGSSQKGESALSANTTLGYLCNMASARQLGRPMIVSETGQPFWNPWRFESGLTWPSFAGLQNWNLVSQFSQAVLLNTTNKRCAPIQPFTISIDPPLRAAQYMASMLYMRGDVLPSTHTVEVRLDRKKLIEQGADLAMPSSLSRLSLLCGLGVQVENSPHPAPRASYRADLTLSPSGGDQVVMGLGAADVAVSQSSGESLVEAARVLRENGALKSGNRTDIRQGIYQSDTGQILVDTRTNHIEVRTALSEGGTVLQSGSMKLNALSVDNRGTPVAVFLGSLDGKELPQSSRMLLLVSSDALNTGMTFLNSRRQVLEELGKMPVLSRVAQVTINVRHADPAKLKLWALAFNGSRAAEIPLKVVNGQMTADIDTGTLPDGPTPFFELADR